MQRLLFHGTSIFDVLESQKQRLRDAVSQMSQDDLNADQPGVVSALVAEHSINVPALKEDGIFITNREVDIDFTHNRSMAFNYGTFGERLILRGLEVTVHAPFDGDAALFGVQPETYTLNPPRGEVINSELQLIYEVLPEDSSLRSNTKKASGR